MNALGKTNANNVYTIQAIHISTIHDIDEIMIINILRKKLWE